MIINKKEINSKDWKDFITWADEGKFLLSNPNLFSKLFSINKDFELEKHIIEFFIYNHHILKDRYSLEFPEWLLMHRKETIMETIDSLMDEFLKESSWSIFKEFYHSLIYYLAEPTKDVEKELTISIKYNEFISELKKENDDYNKLIEYINKQTNINLKGYKK